MKALPLGLKVDPKSPAVLEILHKLEGYDFSRISSDCERKLGWSNGHAENIQRECKQFLALAILDPEHFHAPSRDADEFWHRAILHTQWYGTMCAEVFGTFLHHSPLTEVDSAQQMYRDRTPSLLSYWFGSETYGSGYQFLGTCQQCNTAILPVRPDAEVIFDAA